MKNYFAFKPERSLYIPIAFLSFLVWPFDVGLFSSQYLAVAFFVVYIFFNLNIVKCLKYMHISFSPFFSFLIFLIFYLFSFSDGEVLRFGFYMLKIIFLYFLSFYLYLIFLNKLHDSRTVICWLFFPTIAFSTFCLLQIMLPSFHAWSLQNFADGNILSMLKNNDAGHPYRFLGWNGFLFASHSVALAFTAIAIQLFYKSKKPNIFILCCEFLCIFLSALAGRSGLPIVIIYILFSFTIRFSLFRFVFTALVFLAAVYMLYLFKGTVFFNWLFEPILALMSNDVLASNSVSETNQTYSSFFSFINSDLYDVFGYGVYYPSNESYYTDGLVGSDSGYIRLFFAVGLFGGLFFLLTWTLLAGGLAIKFLRTKRSRLEVLFLLLFISYGFVFFYKSEWLYQNFFVFYTFLINHVVFRPRGFP